MNSLNQSLVKDGYPPLAEKKKIFFENQATIIRTYRAKAEISQEDLAIELRYNNGQMVSNIERGLCGLPLKHIKKTCEVMSIEHEKMKEAILSDLSEEIDFYFRREDENN